MGMIGNSLAQGLISGANIQDGTVDTADLKAGAVTVAKIADDAITPSKLDETGNYTIAQLDVNGTVTAAGLTVDTNTLYVDSTNNRVGIGTSLPSRTLTVNSGTINTAMRLESTDQGVAIEMYDGTTTSTIAGGTAGIEFYPSGSLAATIDSSGNVGIGVVPSAWRSSTDAIQIGQSASISSNNNANAVSFTSNSYINSSNNSIYIATGKATNYYQYDGAHVWEYAGSGSAGATVSYSEAMRIGSTGIIYVNGDSTGGRISGDGSGGLVLQDGNGRQSFVIDSPASGSTQAMTLDASRNLLVGKTSADGGVAGFEARSDGTTFATADSTPVMYVKRKGSGSGDDGNVVVVQNNDGSIGSLGHYGNAFYISGSGTLNGLLFNGSMEPTRETTRTNGVMDIGSNSYGFKDLYLTGGIQFDSRSNKLDDFEEGSYNVTFSGSSGTPIVRYGAGYYIKIGRMVYIRFYAYAGSNPTVPSGPCYASLPFTADTSNAPYTPILGAYSGGLTFNTANASTSQRWQINDSVKLSAYIGNWQTNPAYYEFSGAGCYIAVS